MLELYSVLESLEKTSTEHFDFAELEHEHTRHCLWAVFKNVFYFYNMFCSQVIHE